MSAKSLSAFDPALIGTHSRNELYGILGRPTVYSGLRPANLITVAHFSLSSTISLPKSAGDPGSDPPPRSASRAFIVGSASAALISLLSVSMILAGRSEE